MVRFESSIEIERSPADVFAYLTDVERVPEWQATCEQVTRISDEPLAVGSTFTDVRTFLGHKGESTVEVVELEAERRFSVKTAAGPIPFEVHHTLEADGEGTRLTIAAEAGGVPRLAGALVTPQGEGQLRGDLERLKQILERPTPAS